MVHINSSISLVWRKLARFKRAPSRDAPIISAASNFASRRSAPLRFALLRSDLRKSVPSNVAAAVAKSLEKLPADRFESARTFAEALADPTFTTPAAGVSGLAPLPDRWKRFGVGLVALAAIAALAAVWGWLRPVTRDGSQPVVEFYLDPPDATMSFGANLVLSPDGRRLVAEIDTDDGRVLYQRMLDERDWRFIPGTEGAYAPTFSPDGEWLGFYSSQEGAIKRMPLGGGSAQTITQVTGLFCCASWGADNDVVFSMEATAGGKGPSLFRVRAEGGVPERLTTPDTVLGELSHGYPHYLPSGEVVLFRILSAAGQQTVAALSLEDVDPLIVLINDVHQPFLGIGRHSNVHRRPTGFDESSICRRRDGRPGNLDAVLDAALLVVDTDLRAAAVTDVDQAVMGKMHAMH